MHPGTDSAIGKSDYQLKYSVAPLAGYKYHPSMPSIQPVAYAACIQILIPPLGEAITNQKILVAGIGGIQIPSIHVIHPANDP